MSGALLLAAGSLLLWPVRRRVPGSGPPGAGTTRPRWMARRADVAAAGLGAGLVAGALSTPLVAVLACGAAVLAVRAARARTTRTTEDTRLHALAEALGGLAGDLRAGRPTSEATTAAVTACRDPVVGSTLAGALAGWGPATPRAAGWSRWEQAVDRIAAGVRLSARTGCSLAAIACAVEDDLRARSRLQAELRTATAAPRASALLLAGLPVLAFAMGSGIGADPWRVLTQTSVGQVLLVVGVGLEAAGLAWSARLVRRAVP